MADKSLKTAKLQGGFSFNDSNEPTQFNAYLNNIPTTPPDNPVNGNVYFAPLTKELFIRVEGQWVRVQTEESIVQYDYVIGDTSNLVSWNESNQTLSVSDPNYYVTVAIVTLNGTVLRPDDNYEIGGGGNHIEFKDLDITTGDVLTVSGVNDTDAGAAGLDFTEIKATLQEGNLIVLDTDDDNETVTINVDSDFVEVRADSDITKVGTRNVLSGNNLTILGTDNSAYGTESLVLGNNNKANDTDIPLSLIDAVVNAEANESNRGRRQLAIGSGLITAGTDTISIGRSNNNAQVITDTDLVFTNSQDTEQKLTYYAALVSPAAAAVANNAGLPSDQPFAVNLDVAPGPTRNKYPDYRYGDRGNPGTIAEFGTSIGVNIANYGYASYTFGRQIFNRSEGSFVLGNNLAIEANTDDCFVFGSDSSIYNGSDNSLLLGTQNFIDSDCDNSIAMGSNLSCLSSGTLAVGAENTVDGSESLAMGGLCNVEGEGDVAVGSNLSVTGTTSVIVGARGTTEGDDSVNIGLGNISLGDNSVNLGRFNNAGLRNAASVTIAGNTFPGADLNGTYVVVDTDTLIRRFGDNQTNPVIADATASGDYIYYNATNNLSIVATAFGTDTTLNLSTPKRWTILQGDASNLAVGSQTNDYSVGTFFLFAADTDRPSGTLRTIQDGDGNERVGGGTSTYSIAGTPDIVDNAIVIGSENSVDTDGAIAIGSGVRNSGNQTVAVGDNVFTGSPRDSIAIGVNVGNVSGFDSEGLGSFATAIGHNTRAPGLESSAYGNSARALGQESTAIGQDAQADTDFATALGDGTRVTGRSATAVGRDAMATAREAVALGDNCHASGEESVALGENCMADELNSVAIGKDAHSLHANSVAIGYESATDTEGQIDLDSNNVSAVSLPTHSSDPGGMPAGTIYFNSTTTRWRGYNGSKWGTFQFDTDS